MKVVLCAIARNEQLTIKDWVEYHLSHGIYHIYIFDNNDFLDSSLDEQLGSNKDVTIIRTFKGKRSVQLKTYNYFINNFQGKDWDYAGFIDIDEYLVVNHGYKDFNEYFEDADRCCPNIGTICINWLCYGDNGNYFYEDKPVMERFPNPIPEEISFWGGPNENVHCKGFLKHGVPAVFDWSPHCISLLDKSKLYYNSDFVQGPVDNPFNIPYSYEHAQLNHYCTKSLEEYLVRKFQHRCADDYNANPYDLDYYFHRNPWTEDAQRALEVLSKKYNLNIV